MTGFLLSREFVASFGEGFAAAAREAGLEPQVTHLPDDPKLRLTPEDCARIEVAYLSRDLRFSEHYRTFGDTVRAAPNLKWVHFSSTGIDQHPFLPQLIERGVNLTSSIGSNGEPVGHTAICGLMMLARGFPRWLDAQRRHAWEPVRGEAVPRDLRGQTVVIVGLGIIGGTVARFCRALGMHVVAVRRSPKQPGDPADEMHTPAALPELWPRAQWVVLACTHTPETHHLVNAQTLAQMPSGACVINVSRGGVVDEPALIEALRSGHLAGAYLDVFAKEPLPAESPLWNMPNVIVTPHNAQVSSGNDRRSAEIFLANLRKWARGEPLRDEEAA